MSASIECERGRYVVYIDQAFYCTCDSLREAEEEIAEAAESRAKEKTAYAESISGHAPTA